MNNNDLVSCVCKSCANLSNAANLLTELAVQAGDIDGFLGRNMFLKHIFARRGCMDADFTCEFGPIPKTACYHKTCECSSISQNKYTDIKEELFPRLGPYAFSHSSRIFKLRQVERPDADEGTSGVKDAETVLELGFEEMFEKCLEVIDFNIQHFYEATKSHLAIKKLRSGQTQAADTALMEQDYSEEYASRSGSLRTFENCFSERNYTIDNF